MSSFQRRSELNNLVKERSIKITAPERKRLIREIQKGGDRNILMLFVDCSPKEHIKDKIESHGSMKELLGKIEDLTLEYDEYYQAWLKERDEKEKQQYGAPQTKTERRLRDELARADTRLGIYCVIKTSREYESAITRYFPFDATFPPNYTKVYTNTDEDGHAYTAEEWDRKQRGALTEKEFEAQIIRNLPGTLCDSHCSVRGSFVDEDEIRGCCYVVHWGEWDQYRQAIYKKFAGEEWVRITIEGKKLEYRAAPLKNIQYSAFLQHQIALRFNHHHRHDR